MTAVWKVAISSYRVVPLTKQIVNLAISMDLIFSDRMKIFNGHNDIMPVFCVFFGFFFD